MQSHMDASSSEEIQEIDAKNALIREFGFFETRSSHDILSSFLGVSKEYSSVNSSEVSQVRTFSAPWTAEEVSFVFYFLKRNELHCRMINYLIYMRFTIRTLKAATICQK